MPLVNVHEAKTQLSSLLVRAQSGEEIIISKAGKPIAKLVPVKVNAEPRKPGFWKGKVKIAKSFDDPLPDDIMKAFYGKGT